MSSILWPIFIGFGWLMSELHEFWLIKSIYVVPHIPLRNFPRNLQKISKNFCKYFMLAILSGAPLRGRAVGLPTWKWSPWWPPWPRGWAWKACNFFWRRTQTSFLRLVRLKWILYQLQPNMSGTLWPSFIKFDSQMSELLSFKVLFTICCPTL